MRRLAAVAMAALLSCAPALAQDASQVVGPPPNASNITAGTLAKARGGTGAATGQGAAGVLSMPYLLACSAPSGSTLATSEANIVFCNIPAGLLGINDCLLIDVIFDTVSSTQTATIATRIKAGTGGATNGTSVESASVVAARVARGQQMTCNDGATNSQVSTRPFNTGTGGFSNATTTTLISSAIDTTAAWALSINGSMSAGNGTTDTLKLKHVHVLYLPPGGN